MAWYVIHTFTGHENKVKASIERRAAAQGIGHKLQRILVLTEEEVTGTRGGKKTVRKHKVYPGYVFIEMLLDDETRFLGVLDLAGQLADDAGGDPQQILQALKRRDRS
jgi:transcriptional antiterminator NusG